MQRRQKHISLGIIIAIAWAASVGLGLWGLLDYENKPGTVAAVPKDWPAATIPLATDRLTLVMLAHPHCPCTRASVGELAKIMAEVDGRAAAYVLFSKPTGAGGHWDDTDLRRSAAAITGVTVVSDVDGAEARRFGAETSGHTLLFAADGRLLFSGGITSSRGHAGDNLGESAIVSLVRNGTTERAHTLVFGCSLPSPVKDGLETVALR